MALYIDDGINVDSNATELIAFSTDGTNWDFVAKKSISNVTGIYTAAANLVDPGYKYTNKTIIKLDRSDDHAPIIFELQDVANQSTWTAGTAAALQIAKVDLADFIS